METFLWRRQTPEADSKIKEDTAGWVGALSFAYTAKHAWSLKACVEPRSPKEEPTGRDPAQSPASSLGWLPCSAVGMELRPLSRGQRFDISKPTPLQYD